MSSKKWDMYWTNRGKEEAYIQRVIYNIINLYCCIVINGYNRAFKQFCHCSCRFGLFGLMIRVVLFWFCFLFIRCIVSSKQHEFLKFVLLFFFFVISICRGDALLMLQGYIGLYRVIQVMNIFKKLKFDNFLRVIKKHF